MSKGRAWESKAHLDQLGLWRLSRLVLLLHQLHPPVTPRCICLIAAASTRDPGAKKSAHIPQTPESPSSLRIALAAQHFVQKVIHGLLFQLVLVLWCNAFDRGDVADAGRSAVI